jgi:hypothetical protein
MPARKLDAIIMQGGKCKHCGLEFNGQNECVFDFHHNFCEGKLQDLERLTPYEWRIAVEVIYTSTLLCANCHRLEHWRNE